jgi:hypothetical protein
MLEAEICLNQEVITWGDGIDIHEDLPTHFSRPPSATENLQSSGKDPILEVETSDGEPQLLSRRSPTLPSPSLSQIKALRSRQPISRSALACAFCRQARKPAFQSDPPASTSSRNRRFSKRQGVQFLESIWSAGGEASEGIWLA